MCFLMPSCFFEQYSSTYLQIQEILNISSASTLDKRFTQTNNLQKQLCCYLVVNGAFDNEQFTTKWVFMNTFLSLKPIVRVAIMSKVNNILMLLWHLITMALA